MANWKGKDADGNDIYHGATGDGTTGDPYLSKSADGDAMVTALQAILAKQSADPATQTTLAAVLAKLSSDPATQTTLAAILAKQSADPATQTTLAAILAAVDEVDATPYGGTFSSIGDNSIIATPGAGKQLVIYVASAFNTSDTEASGYFKSDDDAQVGPGSPGWNQGDGLWGTFPARVPWKLPVNTGLEFNSSVAVTWRYFVHARVEG